MSALRSIPAWRRPARVAQFLALVAVTVAALSAGAAPAFAACPAAPAAAAARASASSRAWHQLLALASVRHSTRVPRQPRATAARGRFLVVFRYRPTRHGTRTLARLLANGVRLREHNGRLVLLRPGARPLHIGGRRRHPARVVLRLDVSLHRLTIQVGRAVHRVPLATPAPERQVVLGGRPAPSGQLSGVVVCASPPSAPAGSTSGSTAGSPTPAPSATSFFAAGSVWNAPLADDAALDPNSATYVSELQQQLTLASPWINTDKYSTPIYTVGPDQPTVPVTLDTTAPALQAAWQAVPLPPDAQPAAGSDEHLVVWQPSTDTMWEFWHLQNESGVWHARWGGRMDHVSTNPGYFSGADSSWGATATSLPLLGGLITAADLASGHIDHALAMAIPHTQARVWSWPAQRTDGNTYDSNAIPEGTRFRLDPTLDIAALNLPPLVRMLAEAAQRYGIIVRDQAGAVVFYGQDPTPLPVNPWYGPNGAFGGEWANHLMMDFPWSHLEALQTRTDCCWHH